jgi:hypothetical protein
MTSYHLKKVFEKKKYVQEKRWQSLLAPHPIAAALFSSSSFSHSPATPQWTGLAPDLLKHLSWRRPKAS